MYIVICRLQMAIFSQMRQNLDNTAITKYIDRTGIFTGVVAH